MNKTLKPFRPRPAGKGPQPRPYDPTVFADGWERIFGKREPAWKKRAGPTDQVTPKTGEQ